MKLVFKIISYKGVTGHTLEVVPMSLLLTLNRYLPTGIIKPSKHLPVQIQQFKH